MGVNRQDDRADFLSDWVRVFPAVFAALQLRHVNQTFHAFLEFDEHTKLCGMDDFAVHHSDRVAALYRQPWILAQLLDAQGDALRVAIDVEHASLDFVTLVEAIGGVSDALSQDMSEM